jgi:hypothetical protein
LSALPANNFGIRWERAMIRHRWFSCLVLIFGVAWAAGRAHAVLLLYEPFNYPESNFLSATTVGAPNTTTSPIGYLAPNFNNWYGTGIDAGGYQTDNDGQIIDFDLYIPGLAKPDLNTNALLLGSTGHTMRVSLNSSTMAIPNRIGTNLSDTADPLAGTDGTLQATDTGGTAYYSLGLYVPSVAAMPASGGVLLGFNPIIGAQTVNPITVGAALTIRPKPGGSSTEFQLGILKQGTTNLATATWDPTIYSANTTIFVVGKYQTVGAPQNAAPPEKDDVASLWINPPSTTFGGFEPAGALTSTAGDDIATSAASNNHTLQSFVLRQTGSTVNFQVPIVVVFDELRIGTTWADVTPGVPGDYNGDGNVDGADYVLWRNGGPLKNEVDDRTAVNGADYTAWRARFGTPLYGDYNNDGSVDAADYVLWRKGGPLANEADKPGTIDAGDYAVWRERFGSGAGSGSGSGAEAAPTSIPEPTAGWLLVSGAFVVSIFRRRVVERQNLGCGTL